MKTVKKTQKEIVNSLHELMRYTTGLEVSIAKELKKGNSVLVYANGYIGNGRYDKDPKSYHYKKIVPIWDKHGDIFSTDLYLEKSYLNGYLENEVKCGMYRNRQMAMYIEEIYKTNIGKEFFYRGYQEDYEEFTTTVKI